MIKKAIIGLAGCSSDQAEFNWHRPIRAHTIIPPHNEANFPKPAPTPTPFVYRAAQKELSQDDPPVFLAFLLGLGAGLRRIEIDRLECSAFQWNHHLIRIEPTRYFEPKTEHSIGDVQLDPELMSVFRGYAAQAGSRSFVIGAGGSADLPARTFADHYRAKAVFERLSVWLRAHGISARKPIHELRKEFGSMVNRKHGLSAASDQLRHSGIAITAAYYIDRPHKATSGVGCCWRNPGVKGRRSSSSRTGSRELPPA